MAHQENVVLWPTICEKSATLDLFTHRLSAGHITLFLSYSVCTQKFPIQKADKILSAVRCNSSRCSFSNICYFTQLMIDDTYWVLDISRKAPKCSNSKYNKNQILDVFQLCLTAITQLATRNTFQTTTHVDNAIFT
ncbi:hypothetical protein VCUG_02585 [Vavraia culicis subsp. floridensis]|uniref:Uncharacterized protein n=1 Tax=Vavraia culicis (isolate floridensis) TaxID=948595 RepID=L2GQN6_VAVCU|nr:uncharacterized protein VCUG_02585 [Vavraia culicis subsp. floridensis]ELA45924.1 hypothetical protein VCUG_02585 [Vavraia culicis subsp. floridensis]